LSTELAEHSVLGLDKFLIRKNFWTLFGAKFRIFNMQEGLVATSVQKAFKLKEDIRVFSDEAMSVELLTMKGRKVIDFSSAYDIVDATTQEKVGAIRRKGMKSILKDEWQILDNQDGVIGAIREDSAGMAFLRRFLTNLIPQTFYIELNGEQLGSIKQMFNPFIFKAVMDLTPDTERKIDRRLAVGATVLLLAIEGRQG
jgi:hypothetical protein